MRIMRCGAALVGLVTVLGVQSAGVSSASQSGLVFNTMGFYRGLQSVSENQITCQIPTTSSAIVDGMFAMGMWNTHGIPTLFFPDPNSPYGNPCGVWLQMVNNLAYQSIFVDHVDLKYRIAGAKRYRQFGIATRNGWPTACRGLRTATAYASVVIPPVTATDSPASNAGAVNVAFVQVVPIVSTSVINCLRGVYTGLPADVSVSLPLIIHATPVGVSDAGSTYNSRPVQYTLELRHTCGNGRVDDGEQCDPASNLNSCVGVCQSNKCSNADIGCSTDADCIGTCIAQGSPNECQCAF